MANQKDYQTTLPNMKARMAAMLKMLASNPLHYVKPETYLNIELKVSPKSITVVRRVGPAILFTLSTPKFELGWNEAEFQIKCSVDGKPVKLERGWNKFKLLATKVADPLADTANADAKLLGYTLATCLELVAQSEESPQSRQRRILREEIDRRRAVLTQSVKESVSWWFTTSRKLSNSATVEPLDKGWSILVNLGARFEPVMAWLQYREDHADHNHVPQYVVTVTTYNQNPTSKEASQTANVTEGMSSKDIKKLLEGLLIQTLSLTKPKELAPRNTPQPEAPSYMLSVDDVTSTLKNMSTKSGGRMRSVSLVAGPEWHCEPTNRQRLDHTGNDGEGWDEDEYDEEYSSPLYRQVMDKLENSLGEGLFEIEIGEKGHVTVSLSSKGKQAVKTLRKTASTIVDRWLRLQST